MKIDCSKIIINDDCKNRLNGQDDNRGMCMRCGASAGGSKIIPPPQLKVDDYQYKRRELYIHMCVFIQYTSEIYHA